MSQKQLRGKSIPLMRVMWEGLTLDEATWEPEEDLGWTTLTFLANVKS